MISTIMSLEDYFVCTRPRRFFAAILLGVLIALLFDWIIKTYIVLPQKDPLVIHSATVLTPKAKAGGLIKVHIKSNKIRDCRGQSSTWLVGTRGTHVLGTRPLGVQPVGKNLDLIVHVAVPVDTAPGIWHIRKVLDYDCGNDSHRRVRWPGGLKVTVE